MWGLGLFNCARTTLQPTFISPCVCMSTCAHTHTHTHTHTHISHTESWKAGLAAVHQGPRGSLLWAANGPLMGIAETGVLGPRGTPEFISLFLLLLSHFSRVQLCATPETAAHQAPPSPGFSRQEHWSGLPFPSPMHESEK